VNTTELQRCLSEPRLKRYLSAAGGDHAEALDLYRWNAEVSAAFWFGFNVLEVTLRNNLHRALVSHFGTERWWPAALLTERERNTLSQAERRVVVAGHGSSIDGVIAELSLGFWVGLLSARHHAGLWVPALGTAFEPRLGRRADLHASLQRLQRLRNRIAHHEPVFARDLMRDHELLVSLLGAMSPEASQWVAEHSRVPHVLAGMR
jgi:hypothetical protein